MEPWAVNQVVISDVSQKLVTFSCNCIFIWDFSQNFSTTFFVKLGRAVSFGSVGTVGVERWSVNQVLISDGSQKLATFFTDFIGIFFGKLGRAVSFGSVGIV